MNRLALLALCLLPALGIDARLPGAMPVATFTYACQGSGQSPSVRSSYSVARHPAPRSKSAPVEVYHDAVAPTRAYERIGNVQVVYRTSAGNTTDLIELAMRRARQMGGDALVNVQIDDAAHTQPSAGAVGTLALVASVVRWRDQPAVEQ